MHEPDRAKTTKPTDVEKRPPARAATIEDIVVSQLSSTARIKLGLERNLVKRKALTSLTTDDINTGRSPSDIKIIDFIPLSDQIDNLNPEKISQKLKFPRTQLAIIDSKIQAPPDPKLKIDNKVKESIQKELVELKTKVIEYEDSVGSLEKERQALRESRISASEDSFRNPKNERPHSSIIDPIRTKIKSLDETIEKSLKEIAAIQQKTDALYERASTTFPNQLPSTQDLRKQQEVVSEIQSRSTPQSKI